MLLSLHVQRGQGTLAERGACIRGWNTETQQRFIEPLPEQLQGDSD